MPKRFPPEDVRRTSRLFADHGIGRMGFLFPGGPGETRESAGQSLAFADDLALEMVKLTFGLRIYPYTGLAETVAREGMISPKTDLLQPHFYVAPELEIWLRETVSTRTTDRPHWVL